MPGVADGWWLDQKAKGFPYYFGCNRSVMASDFGPAAPGWDSRRQHPCESDIPLRRGHASPAVNDDASAPLFS